MDCYICERTSPAYTMRYGIQSAVGICHDCGIGICNEHSRKAAEPGSPLLCAECEAKRSTPVMMPRMVKPQPQKASV